MHTYSVIVSYHDLDPTLYVVYINKEKATFLYGGQVIYYLFLVNGLLVFPCEWRNTCDPVLFGSSSQSYRSEDASRADDK